MMHAACRRRPRRRKPRRKNPISRYRDRHPSLQDAAPPSAAVQKRERMCHRKSFVVDLATVRGKLDGMRSADGDGASGSGDGGMSNAEFQALLRQAGLNTRAGQDAAAAADAKCAIAATAAC